MFPLPTMLSDFPARFGDFRVYKFRYEWNWYTDEVLLLGLVFVICLGLFVMSMIISTVITEQQSHAKDN